MDFLSASLKATLGSQIVARRRQRRRLTRLAASYLTVVRSSSGAGSLPLASLLWGLEGGVARRLENDPERRSVPLVIPQRHVLDVQEVKGAAGVGCSG